MNQRALNPCTVNSLPYCLPNPAHNTHEHQQSAQGLLSSCCFICPTKSMVETYLMRIQLLTRAYTSLSPLSLHCTPLIVYNGTRYRLTKRCDEASYADIFFLCRNCESVCDFPNVRRGGRPHGTLCPANRSPTARSFKQLCPI